MSHPVAVPRRQEPVAPPAPENRFGRLKRLAKWIVIVVAVVVIAWYVLTTAVVNLVATHLWFESVKHGPVYTTILEAQILLFCVFAIIGGVVGGLTMRAVRRARPRLEAAQEDRTIRWWFREHEPLLWRVLLALAVIVPAVLAGRHAAGQWQTYLLWRHATPWHSTDPQFHKDLSFFIEVWPFHQLLVALFLQIFRMALWIAVLGSYLYGGFRFRGPGARITRSTTRLISLLLAAWFVTRAFGYWIGRYAVDVSQRGPVTGAGYTDVHASLPGKIVLAVVALIAAALVVANLRIGRVRMIAAAVAVLVIGSAVFGTAWSKLVYQLRESPSAATLDLPEIAHNQKATKAAFGLDRVITSIPYDPSKALHGTTLQTQARKTAQIRLLDPNRLSPTFNVKQELQSYYGFKSTLDIDHYDLNGRSQDVALAVRELEVNGVPSSSWVNTHLVYTHGYGVVAAPTTMMDPQTESPLFLNGGMPPEQQIPVTRPQVYFGQFSPPYSIVGQPPGSHRQLEFDHPGSNTTKTGHTTYAAKGGIPIGSTLRRLLFAFDLNSPNILFSSDINSGSQLLMIRNPRARVAQVAPWLTLDGDVYPAVVSGHIVWVVDGYTSASTYPDSQLVNLHQATTSTLTAQGASIAQPNVNVNYLHNSVKATVDAYTGQVHLYEWNQSVHPDPLLKSWEATFPGLVQPQSDIPSALLSHLRYPQDLFDVQRLLLARYHVQRPADFYSGNDFWRVPTDPTVSANQQFNTNSSSSTTKGPSQPSMYMSLSPTGFGGQKYTLSSPMVTLNHRDLAAFITVNSEPGPDYGKFTILNFPAGGGIEAPSQVQNDIESDTRISEALTLQRGGNSKVVLGDLQSIPLGGRVLYVEPVYTQAAGSSSFPILRHVIALYGNGDPSFQTSLPPALKQAIASGEASD